jgi:hypothetical protein
VIRATGQRAPGIAFWVRPDGITWIELQLSSLLP